MPENWKLKADILKELDASPGQTTQELADVLASFEPDIERVIQKELKHILYCDKDMGWYRRQGGAANEELAQPRDPDVSDGVPELPYHEPSNNYGAVLSPSADEPTIVASALQSLRKRLLDLTGRNRLLNFAHPEKGCVRAIDELPDQLKRYLLDEEHELRFLPVPDPTKQQLIKAGYIEVDRETGEENTRQQPTAREWAQWLGLHTNYEVPKANGGSDDPKKHTDDAIQTMLFSAELEARLRSMRQKANSAMEEAGANILYLALGFLEWLETGDRNARSRLAPLYLLPVRLERGKLNVASSTYEYRVKYSGEDVLTNISLREKLRNDFAIALPELEEGMNPEEYFASVAKAVKTRQPNWKVRRYITLAHLNFSKQLLYLDLDPKNWPEGASIVDHPLVRQCLAGLSESDEKDISVSFEEEHPIDDIKTIHDTYPLIDNADSSQHSAMIDAIDGKNLVIEGPPGTGKSQTITNLIASAIAQHKRVLFVAEKAAALEVVKRRLDQAGLGAFCLELHSHRSQKRRVLDDLSDRIRLKGKLRKPQEIEADIQLYEELKERLRKHANLVNSKWKRTDLTIHTILSAATRYRQELGLRPDELHPSGMTGDSFTAVERKRILGHAKTLAGVYQGVMEQLGAQESLNSHPWFGVRNLELQAYEQDRVVALLEHWQKSLERIEEELSKFSQAVDAEVAELPVRFPEIKQFADRIRSLPDCTGREPLFALPKLRGKDAAIFARAVQVYKAIQGSFETLAQHVVDGVLSAAETHPSVVEAVTSLSKVGAPTLSLPEVNTGLQIIQAITQTATDLADPVERTNTALNLTGSNRLQLSVAGITELARIAEMIASLPPEHLVYRSSIFDNEALDGALPDLAAKLEALKDQGAELANVYRLEADVEVDRLEEVEAELQQAGMFRWLRPPWRRARRDAIALRANSNVRFAQLRDQIGQFAKYLVTKADLEANFEYRRLLGDQFTGLDTDLSRITGLRTWYRAVREVYGIGFGARVPVGDGIIEVSETVARALRSLHKQGISQEAEGLSANVERLVQIFPGVAQLKAEDTGGNAMLSDFATFGTALAEQFSECERAFKDKEVTINTAADAAEKLQRLGELLNNWNSIGISNRYLDGRVFLETGVGKTDPDVLNNVERVASIAERLSLPEFPEALADKLYREPGKATLDLIRLRNRVLEATLQEEAAQHLAFKEAVDLDEEAWLGDSGQELKSIITRNAKSIENPEWLASWLGYLRARNQVHELGWTRLAAAIELGNVAVRNVEAAVMLGALDVLSKQILAEVPELARFSGLNQQSIQRQFGEYDDRLRELQRQLIAWKTSRMEPPAGNSGGRVRDFTELALLKNEINKKTRHVPLRQLMRRSGRAISALKPCFMMGPMSVAQYLAPGQMKFDLVVMDEASQVRPEDALGAVGRGAQLVVVGDPKQLPPTSFFDKLLDEEDEEEDFTVAQQSESILDAALTAFPARRLRWHYRSQHESLIAFSNHAFYGSDLVVFPSPHGDAQEYGVQFTQVKRGRFANRVNREEATLIAKAVRQHMLTHPDESIGVVAMNSQQREQIERAIEQETKEDAHFRDKVELNQHKDEPLFVKNLENVQGDERDVIYISMTYGPAEIGGRVAQRFGPINSIHGWRRLNVLFTRSKKRMRVFSSMTADDIIITPTSSRGVQSLKAFLDYAAHGYLPATVEHTDREPDSDFEITVAAALSNHGFECVPQVGVAGYFVDIAVKDPGMPGRYLMAIECDGATYHSAKSTRDRDRLRQTILESLGWRVRRIWSTDWFNNPVGQIAPIVKELNDLKTVPAERTEDYTEVDQIEDLAEAIDESTELASTIVRDEGGLRAKLQKFDSEVIRREQAETPEDRRLLRPAMLEALLTYAPTTLWEFHQHVPPYLRDGTAASEGAYIARVLEIIYQSEDNELENQALE